MSCSVCMNRSSMVLMSLEKSPMMISFLFNISARAIRARGFAPRHETTEPSGTGRGSDYAGEHDRHKDDSKDDHDRDGRATAGLHLIHGKGTPALPRWFRERRGEKSR